MLRLVTSSRTDDFYLLRVLYRAYCRLRCALFACCQRHGQRLRFLILFSDIIIAYKLMSFTQISLAQNTGKPYCAVVKKFQLSLKQSIVKLNREYVFLFELMNFSFENIYKCYK